MEVDFHPLKPIEVNYPVLTDGASCFKAPPYPATGRGLHRHCRSHPERWCKPTVSQCGTVDRSRGVPHGPSLEPRRLGEAYPVS